MSRTELMTVREMIDASIIFDTGDPRVDFNMLEAILYIIAGELNVLHRQMKVRLTQLKLKKGKLRAKNKTTVAVTQLKIHGAADTVQKMRRKTAKQAKEDSTESTTDNYLSKNARSTRRQTRSKSRSRKEYSLTESTTDISASKNARSTKRQTRSKSRSRKKYSSTDLATDDYLSKNARSTKRHTRSKSRSRKEYSSTELTTDSIDKSGKRQRKPGRDRSGADLLHEKILIVSRTSHGGGQYDHRTSIVNQEQYNEMLSQVRQLQKKFGVLPSQHQTTNKQTGGITNISDLHRPTSLTDPRAALNMGARLEVSHKKLNEMLVVVTNLANGISGMKLDGPFDDIFIHKTLKDTPDASVTPHASMSTGHITGVTESEEVLADANIDENQEENQEDDIDIDNLATWPELRVDFDDIRNNAFGHLSKEASVAYDRAKTATSIFKEAGPKLSEAQLLNVRFARLRISCDSFNNKITAFDANMAGQLSDCQENVSEMQYMVETIVERIEACLANPAEDPVAVAAIKDDFAEMQFNLSASEKNQTALKENQHEFDADLKRIQKSLEMISRVKTTTEEALEALKNKANVVDVNGLLSKVQLSAIVGYMQNEIVQMSQHIESGETEWQLVIDDNTSHLREKCDRVQVRTLNNSLRDYYDSMNAEVEAMLNIAGDIRVNIYKKKLDRDGKCLSCGTPANVKVPDKYMHGSICMLNQQVDKPIVSQDDETLEGIEPCVPGRPIPHALDPRALICDRYCGATLSKSGESLPSSLGLDVTDINPTHGLDTMEKKVHLRCTPCSRSEETLYK